ncbi:hypothetical protein M409DRAFT_28931 [Zasmidium cellare ATCC 36951]|uniref:Fungal-specific transcription factor domain-containing protein n=1 Tax=Zasmidium cellare ATCC 36951 TaxID=1080233 RepID=A0A6A6C0H1_ZASCE|nr:uncharacterized protein M409DRAFT_28931 [Zasmidium cellare ATCC 36951]KAF2160547.1 hypothetical protein M409DRAFT_28931 [Zasmidium cellare ATCC 36951]
MGRMLHVATIPDHKSIIRAITGAQWYEEGKETKSQEEIEMQKDALNDSSDDETPSCWNIPSDTVPPLSPMLAVPLPTIASISLSPSTTISQDFLLEFFILEESRGLCGRAPCDDPFIRLALQLSQSDELIQSGILALSGSRMFAKHSSPSVQEAALRYHNRTILQVREAVASWPPKTGEDVIRLLTASILLCHYEALLGNEQDSLQAHLRACRQIVEIAQQHPSTLHYSAIYGVLFEAYAYYSIQIIFRYAASEADVQATIQSLQFYRSLTTYSTFGYLMQATCDFYTLIPHVALFGLRIRGVGDVQHSQELETLYRRLESLIISRQPGVDDDAEASTKVATIYRNSLLIILHASYLGHLSEYFLLQARLKPIISETMSLFESVKDTETAAPAFWPMVLLGSCLRDQKDQDCLLKYLEYGGTTAGCQNRANEALQWIWNRHSQSTFGPAGLEAFSVENNTGLCIG